MKDFIVNISEESGKELFVEIIFIIYGLLILRYLINVIFYRYKIIGIGENVMAELESFYRIAFELILLIIQLVFFALMIVGKMGSNFPLIILYGLGFWITFELYNICFHNKATFVDALQWSHSDSHF